MIDATSRVWLAEFGSFQHHAPHHALQSTKVSTMTLPKSMIRTLHIIKGLMNMISQSWKLVYYHFASYLLFHGRPYIEQFPQHTSLWLPNLSQFSLEVADAVISVTPVPLSQTNSPIATVKPVVNSPARHFSHLHAFQPQQSRGHLEKTLSQRQRIQIWQTALIVLVVEVRYRCSTNVNQILSVLRQVRLTRRVWTKHCRRSQSIYL